MSQTTQDSTPPKLKFLFVQDLLPRLRQEVLTPPIGVRLLSWDRFNTLTGGLRMHELSLMTSDTGTGKTTFLANLAVQAVLQGFGVYIASVEIGPVAFLLAMISVLAQRDFNTGEAFPPSTWEQIEREWIPLLVKSGRVVFANHDSRVAAATLTAEMSEAHERFGTKFAILDNFQFFSMVPRAEEALIEQDKAIREFVTHSKRVPMHTFLIVHCRKTQNDNGRIEQMADMKGSKTLSDEAANVFALNKPRSDLIAKGDAQRTDRELLFLKLRRRGKNVGKHVAFYYDEGLYGELKLSAEGKLQAPKQEQLGIGL